MEILKKVVSYVMTLVIIVGGFWSIDYNNNAKAASNIVMPKLIVDGSRLLDSSTGKQVQLRGMSTHGIAWYPEFVNADAFAWLKENMDISVIRVSMYTSEWGGYCVSTGNKTQLKNLIKKAVEYATELGLYVIIDWHMLGADEADKEDCNPLHYVTQAKEFFGEMSEYFKDYNNIIYEICNEPNDGEYGNSYDVNWNVIKEYANQVIPVIRKNTDNVIIVGTPDWSSDVTSAKNDLNNANSLSKKYDNIMYTYHFYAASHGSWYRTRVEDALKAGLPIFVTEFDCCDSAGDGNIDENSTKAWLDLFDSYGVSYVKWNLSNKDETSAFVKSSCNKTSGWSMSDISASGQYMMNQYITRINENKYGISAPKPLGSEPETTTTIAKKQPEIEINGCQISTTVEGYRVIYSVSEGDYQIDNVGLIFGLEEDSKDADMVVGSKNHSVFSYQATNAGKADFVYSDLQDAQSYVMTMKFIKTADFYNAGIKIRAYAKLSDGSYIYGDIHRYSVYGIADCLYREQKMSNSLAHNYLYQNILNIVDPAYEIVDYEWNNIIIKPDSF